MLEDIAQVVQLRTADTEFADKVQTTNGPSETVAGYASTGYPAGWSDADIEGLFQNSMYLLAAS